MLTPALKAARRIVVAVVGATVILIGVALLVLPGPGWVTIFAGVGLLATEFVWARRLLHRARTGAQGVWGRLRQAAGSNLPPEAPPGPPSDSSQPPPPPPSGQTAGAPETPGSHAITPRSSSSRTSRSTDASSDSSCVGRVRSGDDGGS